MRDEDPEKTPVDRRRYPSTLVGHPTDALPPPIASGPVLRPPKWRGAQAYQGGEDPQPRISSIPSAPPSAAIPPASRMLGPDGKPITRVVSPPPPAPAPAREAREVGATIEELLDGQAAVPMEVDERAAATLSDDGGDDAGDDGGPITEVMDARSSVMELGDDRSSVMELALEDVLESFSDPDLGPSPVVSPPEPAAVARIQLGGAAPIDFDEDEVVIDPELPPERDIDAPRIVPVPVKVALDREERAELPNLAPPAPDMASSLAPAEVAAQQRTQDSGSSMGILLVAAMAVIGIGGWFLTRGTYQAPRAERPAPAQPAAAVAAPPAQRVAEPAAQPVAEAPAEQPAPAPERPSSLASPSPAPRASKVARATVPKAVAPPAAPEEQAALAPVLAVKPRSVDLPDTPSRDAVVAALAPIQAAVRACAKGQRGVAQVDLTVVGTGSVTHAIVGGDFAGTPEGSCIARTVRGARFASFKQPRFRVIYPFSL